MPTYTKAQLDEKFRATVAKIVKKIEALVLSQQRSRFYPAEVSFIQDGSCHISIDNCLGDHAPDMAQIAKSYDGIEVLDRGTNAVHHDWASDTFYRPNSWIRIRRA